MRPSVARLGGNEPGKKQKKTRRQNGPKTILTGAFNLKNQSFFSRFAPLIHTCFTCSTQGGMVRFNACAPRRNYFFATFFSPPVSCVI